jgi:hypothetical protein
MASLMFFDTKLARETGRYSLTNDPICCAPDLTSLATTNAIAAATIALPYEFPTAGDYRVWVQVKTGGQVKTAAFEANVK